jgi:hypothetical protein
MHSIAFTYGTNPEHPTPEEEKAATNFFDSLSHLLPCEACRKHYEEYVVKNPPDTTSRDALSHWVYDLHTDVNRRRHVEGPTYLEVKNDYTGWNRDKMQELSSYSVQGRLERLSDPHFGRTIAHKLQEEMGGVFDSPDKLISVVIIGAVLGGFLYYINKNSEDDKK